MTTLAITGATGFVGRVLVDRALAAGHHVRALTRRAQPARDGVTWVEGALDRPGSLADLVAGSDAVIHVAGVVSAPDRAGFVAGNVDGTRTMIAATQAAGIARFVHVSSLSAREPQLSLYGWSKRESEALVAASPLDWTIVRPTGVYGAGDMEMRDMFRLARFGLALLPPPGKVSLIAVEDLARLLLALAERSGPSAILEADDGHVLTHAEMARLIGRAVGRRVWPIHLPAAGLRLGAALDRRLRGTAAKLTADRVGYLCHGDWTADPARRPPPALWTATTTTGDGLAATARWYRANGLL
ncbi:NAD-dependent epimerase/dehydratase family protein [Sphingomonas sp. MA1305]|uniref:NAD-dependent epimerase/dehydratase family protein n=1 Tax=Sphingomonas sp. MA1305 TaxID=2479204 RepID=UPI0018E031FE|nr:NAD(P)H-binding protein [Sphingomonas sp. MA1305]MBI0476331.1 NAD-dependent epimerase/dehydratase family protein [Sphingomonas sp. MA1305]